MMATDPYPADPEGVPVDTLVDRPDLGPGCTTLVAAGDSIPANLAHHAHRPAHTEAKSKRKS